MDKNQEIDFLSWVATYIRSYLSNLKTDSKYYRKFKAKIVEDQMGINGVEIIYLANEDVQVNLGFDVDVIITISPSVFDGILGDFSRHLHGSKGFTISKLKDFLETTLNELFLANRVDEIIPEV